MSRHRLACSLPILLLAAPCAPASPSVPSATAASWLRPVAGPVLRGFAVGRDRYARGQHRGVDLAAARGAPVGSACGGRVSFAGRVPRGGPTVSVRCGAIVATYQQLGSIDVRAGDSVARGMRLGRVGASSDPREPRPHLHLGAREAATGRYLDPLALLRGAHPGVPLLPPAGRRAPRATPLGPAPAWPRAAPVRPAPAWRRAAPVRPAPAWRHAAPARPAPASRLPVPVVPLGVASRPGPALPAWRPMPAPSWRLPAGAGHASPRAAPGGLRPGIPWPVWLGLACVGLGLPIGGCIRVRQRRRAASRVARTA